MLLIQVVTQPNEAESISIYNPTDSPIDLTNYYICDDEEYYKMQTEGDLSPSSSSSGFTARFPATLIAPFDTLVIVFNENYSNFYGTDFIPDLFLFGSSVFSMLETEQGSFGIGNNKINEISELIILFYWDGLQESLIKDVDYVIWGEYQNSINKTGISDYLPDSAPSDQFIKDFDIETYYAFSRTTTSEVSELQSGGNGITGHDETSEYFQEAWSLTMGCTDPYANNFNILAKIDDCSCEYSQPRLKVCTYNLWQMTDNSYDRALHFKKIISELCCDILAVQEIIGYSGEEYFYNEIISQINQEYLRAPFIDDPYSSLDQTLYYKPSIDLISTSYIPTDLRNINEFILAFENDTFIVYNFHLKASPDYESWRLSDIQTLNENINNNYPNILLGDYNIYTSAEPAFQYLINEMQLTDPLDLPDWQNDQYGWTHTQNTRSDNDWEGGLDDRFDMILISDGINYLPETYNAFGNDGTLYNLSINNTSCAGPDACDMLTQSDECEDDDNCSWKVNKAVRQEIADALYYASDHLPVTLDLIFIDNIQGDINIDGILNILDLVILANMVLAEEYIEIADMNYDGVLNVLDVVILVNNILNP